MTKFCNGCKTEKRRDEFYRRSGSSAGAVTPRCKQCMRQATKDYRERTGYKTLAFTNHRELQGQDRIPNEELREAVVRAVAEGRISWARLAKELGHMRLYWQRSWRVLANGERRIYARKKKVVAGDGQYVKRMLGAKTYVTRTGKRHRQTAMHYDTAVRIAEIIGLDPVDVGL